MKKFLNWMEYFRLSICYYFDIFLKTLIIISSKLVAYLILLLLW